MIDLRSDYREMVLHILKKHIPDEKVWVFGSRAKRTANNSSDLDLVIVSKDKISPRVMAALNFDFEESDLPFKVDILDWQNISDEFKQVIKENYIVFFNGQSSKEEDLTDK